MYLDLSSFGCETFANTSVDFVKAVFCFVLFSVFTFYLIIHFSYMSFFFFKVECEKVALFLGVLDIFLVTLGVFV